MYMIELYGAAAENPACITWRIPSTQLGCFLYFVYLHVNSRCIVVEHIIIFKVRSFYSFPLHFCHYFSQARWKDLDRSQLLYCQKKLFNRHPHNILYLKGYFWYIFITLTHNHNYCVFVSQNCFVISWKNTLVKYFIFCIYRLPSLFLWFFLSLIKQFSIDILVLKMLTNRTMGTNGIIALKENSCKTLLPKVTTLSL